MKIKILLTILLGMLLSSGSYAQKRHGGGRSKAGHVKTGKHTNNKEVHPYKGKARLSDSKRKKP